MRSFRSFETISGFLGISENFQEVLGILQEFWIFDKNQEFIKSFSNISRILVIFQQFQEFSGILGFFWNFQDL
jgi:hypothetical protein